MGCFPCFDSAKRDELNRNQIKEEKKKEEQPMVPPKMERLQSCKLHWFSLFKHFYSSIWSMLLWLYVLF
jgi:hypothetical protein